MRVVWRLRVNGENRYIAIVDDESGVRTALRRLLHSRQFATALFANGEAFLRSVSARRPDCALVDIDMPGISGFEVARRLNAARIDVPVILMSGRGHWNHPHRIGGHLPPRILDKPFTIDELLKAISAALRLDS